MKPKNRSLTDRNVKDATRGDWRVHRFTDLIAVSVGLGETIYLTPWAAAKLAKALQDCQRDVMTRTYQESQYQTRKGRLERTPIPQYPRKVTA